MREYRADVLDPRAGATANQRYRSLTQLFRWPERESEIPQSPMHRWSTIAQRGLRDVWGVRFGLSQSNYEVTLENSQAS